MVEERISFSRDTFISIEDKQI